MSPIMALYRKLRRRNLSLAILAVVLLQQALHGNCVREPVEGGNIFRRRYHVAAEQNIRNDHLDEFSTSEYLSYHDLTSEQVLSLDTNKLELEDASIPVDSAACEALEDAAEYLPDVVFIPFEETSEQQVLHGWEDELLSTGAYDDERWGSLEEPKIDVIYTWVNGSDPAFQSVMRPYELRSPLNDPEGAWISRHSTNRYRDWDELRYSLRSIAMYADGFVNKIQVLVNSVGSRGEKQQPHWLKRSNSKLALNQPRLEVLTQEDFFEQDKKSCLPVFNSLTIENQIFNTPSEVDHVFALSDDMMLMWNHTAADIFSPLFGPMLGFKDDVWNVRSTPTLKDTHRFGEKPFLVYTSWLLNQRFGIRGRKVQAHFGHSFSRSVGHEVLRSFPRSFAKSMGRRFRGEPSSSGEPGFQLYFWYAVFHYVIERHREALLWSYLVSRMDHDGDGFLSWSERQAIIADLEEGIGSETVRTPVHNRVDSIHDRAGLNPPQAKSQVVWTSLDGPVAIKDLHCPEFDVDRCLAPGFSLPDSSSSVKNPFFASSTIWHRAAHEQPGCGDCLLKIVLNRASEGLEPLLPKKTSKDRGTIIKALMRYKYSVVEPNSLFEMVTDAQQVNDDLLEPLVRAPWGQQPLLSQMCLNDDVVTTDIDEIEKIHASMHELFSSLFPYKSPWEGS